MLRLAGAMAMCPARELEIEDLKNHSRELVNGHTFVKHPGQLYYPRHWQGSADRGLHTEEIHRRQMKNCSPCPNETF